MTGSDGECGLRIAEVEEGGVGIEGELTWWESDLHVGKEGWIIWGFYADGIGVGACSELDGVVVIDCEMEGVGDEGKWAELVSALDGGGDSAESIGAGDKYVHGVHVDGNGAFRCKKRGNHDLKPGVCGYADGVELIAYSGVYDFGGGWNLVGADSVLSLNDNSNIVEVIELLREGDEDPAAGGDGNWACNIDGEEGGLVDLHVWGGDRLEDYWSISWFCLRIDDCVWEEQVRIVSIGSRVYVLVHSEKDALCCEHGVSVEVGCSGTGNAKNADSVSIRRADRN